MIGRTNAGGGGLSLTVKTHASAPAESQSGKENEIWVVSDTPSQYWAAKATEPTASDWGESDVPNGALWFVSDGGTIEFDVVKDRKKYVGFYASNCKQFENGKWNTLDTYIFRDRAWSQFTYAKKFLSLASTKWGKYTESGSRVNFLESGIEVLTYSADNAAIAKIRTVDLVDFSKFSTIEFVLEVTKASNNTRCGIRSTTGFPPDNSDSGFNVMSKVANATGEQIVTLDISNYTSDAYVVITTRTAQFIVKSIALY